MMNRSRYESKVVVVSGGADGVGRAAALKFAAEGASVAILDMQADKGRGTARDIRDAGGRAAFFHADVSNRDEVYGGIDGTISEYGQVDVLFNHAGTVIVKPFLETTIEDWDRLMAINVTSMVHTCQATIPHMLEKGGGVIVNIASIAIKMGGAGNSVHYASAKGAVHVMTTGIGREFARQGIRCLSISPGPVDTPFHADTPPELLERFKEQVPMGRMASPEEIAETVLFACSDAAPFMTADTIFVSGGMR